MKCEAAVAIPAFFLTLLEVMVSFVLLPQKMFFTVTHLNEIISPD